MNYFSQFSFQIKPSFIFGTFVVYLNTFISNSVSLKFLFGRLTGTWGFKFPHAKLRFVIRKRKITIGKRTIRLRPSKDKRFRGWWTFPYRKVTYYVRFTSRGIRVVKLVGKRVVTARLTSKPKRRPHRPHRPRPRPRPRPHKPGRT